MSSEFSDPNDLVVGVLPPGCEESNLKKYQTRPSPPYPAQDCPDVTMRRIPGGPWWTSVMASNGVYRWVKMKASPKKVKKVSPKVSLKTSPKRKRKASVGVRNLPAAKRMSGKYAVKVIQMVKQAGHGSWVIVKEDGSVVLTEDPAEVALIAEEITKANVADVKKRFLILEEFNVMGSKAAWEEIVKKAKKELAKKKTITSPINGEKIKTEEVEVPDFLPIQKKINDDPDTNLCIKASGLPLKEHQKKIVKYILANKGLLVVHGVGTGKTLAAVTAAECCRQELGMKIIVVTPVSLQGNFVKEAVRYGVPQSILNTKYVFFTLAKFADLCEDSPRSINSSTMVIIDEAHNLRSSDSKRVRNIVPIASNAGRILLLTATPFVNGAEDIVPLANMVGRDVSVSDSNRIFGSEENISAAVVKETRALRRKEGSLIVKLRKTRSDAKKEAIRKELDEIAVKIALFTSGKTVSDAVRDRFLCIASVFMPERGDDYPELTRKNVKIVMPDEFHRHYTNVELKNSTNLARVYKNPFAFLTGVRQALDEIPNSPKISWVVDKILDDVRKKRKIVVFSNFVSAGIMNVQGFLVDHKIPHLVITGSDSAAKRASTVRIYNREDRHPEGECYVLLISKAGGEGLDLKEVRDIVLIDGTWNPAAEEQVVGRAVRYKSHEFLPVKERTVTAYFLYLVKPDSALLEDEEGEVVFPEKKTKVVSSKHASADEMIYMITRKKDEMVRKALGELDRLSIENNDC